MTITASTLRATKYWPELIPNAGVLTVGAGARSANQLALQQVGERQQVWVRMNEMIQPATAGLIMEISSDDMLKQVVLAAIRANVRETYDLESTDYLAFAFSNPTAAPIANHTWIHGLWVYEPTVAHKLARGVKLNPQEAEIAGELNLYETVEKGLLPLPLMYQILREYAVIQEVTDTRSMALAAGVTTVIDTIPARPNEAIVLTGFSCTPGALNDIFLTIDRDTDSAIVDNLPTFAQAFATDNEVFIPAVRELVIKARSVGGLGAGGFNIRYKYRRVRLTNLLKARWGLANKEQLPGDVWKKVRSGIL